MKKEEYKKKKEAMEKEHKQQIQDLKVSKNQVSAKSKLLCLFMDYYVYSSLNLMTWTDLILVSDTYNCIFA